MHERDASTNERTAREDVLLCACCVHVPMLQETSRAVSSVHTNLQMAVTPMCS